MFLLILVELVVVLVVWVNFEENSYLKKEEQLLFVDGQW
jgi:hypothetical protein